MKCKRCEKDADLDVNNESLCYDCAVVRVHELIEDAIAKDAIVREANLLARVAELSCRIPYDRRETMDAAEKYALVRGFRAIAAVIGGTDELSLADVVKKVTAIVARVADLEAEAARLKAPRSAKVKPDWKMPVPLQCLHCRNPLPPTASLVSDGEWILSWDDPCRFCHVPSTSFRFMRDIDWPFVDTHATAADFEALGFRVEVA